MNYQKAFGDTFNQTLIGVVIGFGGFSTLIPNMLESVSKTVEVGSYVSLRIFSMAFFLLPILCALAYWWSRGAMFYYKHVNGTVPERPPHHNMAMVLAMVLNLIPVALFLNDQFFLYTIGLNKIVFVLAYYEILAIIQLIFFVVGFGEKNRTTQESKAFLQANIIVFSLQLILGVGMAAFIEPWMIYKAQMGWIIPIMILIYLAIGVVAYRRVDSKGNLAQYKDLSIALTVLVFIFINFPMLSSNAEAGILVLVLSFIFLFLFGWVREISFLNYTPKFHFTHKFLSVGAGLILVLSVLVSIQYFFVQENSLKLNKFYMASRMDAIEEVSNKKIHPFVVLDEKYWEIIPVDSTFSRQDSLHARYELIQKISAHNHLLTAYLNERIDDPDAAFIDLKGEKLNLAKWLTESPDTVSVRNVFFKPYLEKNSFARKDGFTTRLDTATGDEIRFFYNQVYHNIESLIKILVANSQPENPFTDSKEYINYQHPINYYTETLLHYKHEYQAATKVEELLGEYAMIDSLLTSYPQVYSGKKEKILRKIWEQLHTLTEYKSMLEKDGFDPDNKSEIYIPSDSKIWRLTGQDIESPTNQITTRNLFTYIKAYKGQQYYERYGKAQTIFRAYLVDCQQTGLFVLFYTLVVMLLLYWLQRRNKKETEIIIDDLKNTSSDASPQGFLKIGLLVLAILILHVARPIKKEHINPEQPYWMMDLDNWYERGNLGKLLGKEDNTAKVENKYGGDQYYIMKAEMEKMIDEIRKGNDARQAQLDEIKDGLE